MLINRAQSMRGMAGTAVPYTAGTPLEHMRYADLLAIANANRDKDGAFKPYVMFRPDLNPLTIGSANGIDPDFFWSMGDYGLKLFPNPDGSIGAQRYEFTSEWGILPALAMVAAPFLLPGGIGGGLFGSAGATAGAVETVGWTSGYDLAMGADLLSMTGLEAVAAASPLSLPSWMPSAQTVQTAVKAIGTVASVTGAITGGSSGATRTTLPRTSTLPYGSTPYPQVATQYTHARPADDQTMLVGLGVAGAIAAALFLTRG